MVGMSLKEATEWVGPEPNYLEALYPDLSSHDERVQAWLEDNWEAIEEAVGVYIASPEFEDVDVPPASIGFDPSGSLFAECRHVGDVPVYWDPPTIEHDIDGYTYTVAAPQHVTTLHAFRDRAPALAYLQANYDSRTVVKPLVFVVHDGWHADVVGQWPKDGKLKNMVRYTLYAWHKHEEYNRQPDWIACRHYFSEHYDLKEVVDPEGRVVSSELSTDCLERMISRL
ncbi:hypothetical protein B0H19DRAFT_1248055 [Mycena capillaripes]|nr:hypothetical protein B0H19DRAFT_1248055 [Mycena capillaripes]